MEMKLDPGGGGGGGMMEMGVINPAFSAGSEQLQTNGESHPGMSVQERVRGVDEDSSDLPCGWGSLRPHFLQRFRTAKWVLFCLCWAGGLQGMVVNGFVNVGITTMERRFGLRSSQTGLVAGGYDIASFLCLVPVTYFGGRVGTSKPRWLAWGVLIMGAGSALFSLPHFLVGPYRAVNSTESTCNINNSTQPPFGYMDCEGLTSSSESSIHLWLFLIGQLLHGAGSAPLFTLGVTYIDENVSKKMSSLYLGIYYTMAIVGPAIGYVVGGQLLQIYTDFLTTDSSQLSLTPQSNVWVGAWWIGFVISAIMSVLIAIPLMSFPRELPGSAELRAEKVSEAHESTSTTAEAFSKLHEMPRALRSLLVNPTFFFLNLAAASEGLLLSGFSAFLAKFMESQFSIAASTAAVLMGLVAVTAGGGGTFLGGYLVKKLSLNCSGIMKLCLVATIIGVFPTLGFLDSCPNIGFAGVTRPYEDVENATAALFGNSKPSGLLSTCNSACQCHRAPYDPVCGADNVMYYSPCHAGCKQQMTVSAVRVYVDCSCVNTPKASMPESASLIRNRRGTRVLRDQTKSDVSVEYDAINEPCSTSCTSLWRFLVFVLGYMLMAFIITMPALTATLRSVQEGQRSFALGIQWLKVRLLGTIPAPIIFGLLIDNTCELWQQEICSQDKSNCLVYNNQDLSRYMLALSFVCKTCSVIFFFFAWWLYRPPLGLQSTSQEKLENGVSCPSPSDGDQTADNSPPQN